MPPILIKGMDDMQKMATIYSTIYTIAANNRENWQKYAILAHFL